MSRLQTNAIRHLGSAVDNLTLDNAGRVLMPNKPAFIATAGSATITTGVVVVLTTAELNIGGCYNTSNGRFTAPVTGTYRFSITGLYTWGAGAATFKGIWRRNGSGVGVAYEYQTASLNNSYNTIGSSSVLVYCTAGDYVDLVNGDIAGHGAVHISGTQTKLCGELVG